MERENIQSIASEPGGQAPSGLWSSEVDLIKDLNLDLQNTHPDLDCLGLSPWESRIIFLGPDELLDLPTRPGGTEKRGKHWNWTHDGDQDQPHI